jgi:hypothetical protein
MDFIKIRSQVLRKYISLFSGLATPPQKAKYYLLFSNFLIPVGRRVTQKKDDKKSSFFEFAGILGFGIFDTSLLKDFLAISILPF